MNFFTVVGRFYFRLFFLVSFLTSPIAEARDCSKEGFLPPNRLNISTTSALSSGMTQQTYNQILDKVEKTYSPVFSQRGARLVVDRKWNDGQVNAYAKRSGNNWIIEMYGGMARHQLLTEDGFALIACHEIGHHIGASPKYPGMWAANEGQSDYFASLKCLRNVWAADDNSEIIKNIQTDPSVAQACQRSFGDQNSISLCVRASMAGLSAAKVSYSLSRRGTDPSFATPDPSVVSSTFNEHPVGQCRLDTYFAGAICQVAASEPLSEADPTVGTCSVERNEKVGVRPQCWYKPGSGGTQPVPGGVARQPLIQGQAQIVVNNPFAPLPISYDVSEFAGNGAAGAYLEVIGPNRDFSDSNGTRPDPTRVLWRAQRGLQGQFVIVPANDLPMGWGTYFLRVIPLDAAGQSPVAKFSNSSQLVLQPTRIARGTRSH